MSRKSIAVVACLAMNAFPMYANEIPTQPQLLDALVNQFFDYANAVSPEDALLYGRVDSIPTGLRDNSVQALLQEQKHEDELLGQLALISGASLQSPADKTTYAILKHLLQSVKEMRVCRSELWNLNHLVGWQMLYPQIITMQPVETEKQRADVLARWQKLPKFIENELSNLKTGIKAGYSAPKTVVNRVIDGIEGLLSLSDGDSPLMAPATNTDDKLFVAKWQQLVNEEIKPAMRAYADYLKTEYLPQARTALGLVHQPNGKACYSAYYYMQTNIHRTPESIYQQGQALVNSNVAAVIELGQARWQLDSFEEIIAKAKAENKGQFTESQELVNFSQVAIDRAKGKLADYFQYIPDAQIKVEAWPDNYKGTGAQNSYHPATESQPYGVYKINAFEPTTGHRAQLEITAFHEGYPGHHLQVASAKALATSTPIQEYYGNGTYVEGWGRYAEVLADEMGLYLEPSANILRRTWPGRGMVVDPGIHLFGWTRQQAVEYINQSGRFSPGFGESLVDRIAVLPAQLTTYDSGALEFLRLRANAQEKLGKHFDLKVFHQLMLEDGTVPMALLEQKVDAWIVNTLLQVKTAKSSKL